ncbi:SusC/RagA family TonB-linked outer membrane protein [Sediminitomix flava]|uniref:TonB-linked SusC/RagA family outer membrane protein n=1 Tax=Sediminitomix flava TaxID=379075 RepID=A0A315Z1H1_SEDFL|nr:TonB-dependent receptor [Sediminitomix flava]PWJ36155.1 TonB-linked SusC/RagA family outer membrane protein [Sediminitomix flava]
MFRFFCCSISKLKPWLAFVAAWMLTSTTFAQERMVEGKIISGEDNQPLPGVSILVQGTKTGTITDFDGMYKIAIPEGGTTLVFSYIGYVGQEVEVGNQTNIDITLTPDAEQLDEIVVVGYGVQKKSVVTGAIASVKEADIVKTPVVEAGQALQGRTPGVTVVGNSGQPGAGFDIRVRGTGSNGNNTPLYVVDGLQLDNIDHLNPGDISSIEVLKDAASAAVYGSRGANGVVIVTTKKGKAGKLTVNYDGYYGVQSAWRKAPVLNAKEYMILHNEGAMHANKSLPFSAEEMSSNMVDTDWQDQIYDTAPITNHTVQVSGGSEVSSYLASVNYFGQQGFVAPEKSQFDRFTMRLNSSHQLSDYVKFGQNLSYTRSTKQGINEQNEFGSVLQNAILHDPLTPAIITNPEIAAEYSSLSPSAVRDANGNYYGISQRNLREIVNPLARIQNTYDENIHSSLYGNGFLEVTPGIEGLKVRTDVGFKLSNGNNRGYTPEAYYNVVNTVTADGVWQGSYENVELQWENIVSYDKTIDKHTFGVLLGTTLIDRQGKWFSGNRTNLQIKGWDYAYLANGADDETQKSNSGFWQHRMLSYFGRLTYNYDEKYMLNAVLRYDGSTNFGTNNQFGLFTSIQGGWVVSRENFLVDNDVLTFLKLRAGYGETGNESIEAFAYLPLVGATTNYIIGSAETPTTGFAQNKLANPNLQWEHAQEVNFGIDAGLWNDKLTMNLDAYQRTRKNLLGLQPIPAYTGIGQPSANLGEVRNQGIELALAYRKREGDFHYEIAANVAYNDNEVQKVATGDGRIYGDGAFQYDGQLVMEQGHALPYFYGYKTNGIIQNQTEADAYNEAFGQKAVPGDIRFVDTNGDGVIDGDDRTDIGDPQHDWTFGLNISMDYKGFDFSMFWQGQQGAMLFNATQRLELVADQNYNARYLNRWTGEGSTNSFPRFTHNDTNGNFTRINDMVHLEDASYLRLKNIQIGYTLPQNICAKAGMTKARFYLSVQNAFTFTEYTGLDPEVGHGSAMGIGFDRGSYPQARTFLLGTNISF